MEATWETTWSSYLKLDRVDLAMIEKSSRLKSPLCFLLFLDKVSREKEMLKLPMETLKCLKKDILLKQTFTPIEDKAVFMASSPCPLKFACNAHSSRNLPKYFESNKENENLKLPTINLGNDRMTQSLKEARDYLWERQFPTDQCPIDQTRFIPQEFVVKIPNIPDEFKDSYYRVIKQVISCCERFSNAITNQFKNANTTDRLLGTMKWAQTLMDVWSNEIPKNDPLWKEKDWLETLVAPLYKDGADRGSTWSKLQENFRQQINFDVHSLLENYNFNGKEVRNPKRPRLNCKPNDVKLTKTQKRKMAAFLTSSKVLLATFFIGKVLGITSPQSEPLVQKNGTLVGDIFEKDVFQTLRDVVSKYPKWITVFCGLKVLGIKQSINEFDFLIILGQVKKIIYVECKYTLNEKIAEKIEKQSVNAFNYLKRHLPVNEGWEFLTWACYEEQTQFSICSNCQPFLVRVSSLEGAFEEMLKGNRSKKMEIDVQKEYEALVKTFLFHASTNEQILDRDEVSQHQLKSVDFSSHAIILWNLNQLKILHKDPLRMILTSRGKYGTGKTEVLKTKVAKLAEDPRNFVALLAARKSAFQYTNVQLLTKWFDCQFKSKPNVKVADLEPNKNIQQLILDMFKEGQVHRNQIHVFIDEASKDNRDQIVEFLDGVPKDSENVIWIVYNDDDEMDLPNDQDFDIEDGLIMNLRNSEDVQNTIPFIGENVPPFLDYDDEEIAQRICSELEKEQGAKQILVLVESSVIASELISSLNGKGIGAICYGFHQKVEDCSDGDLEAFFNAQSQGKRQILVTKEDLVTGIEIEMVLLHELHDIDDRATHFRAKTILRTAFLNHVAHPALLQKYQVPILQADDEGWVSTFENFDDFDIDRYAKLAPGPEWTGKLFYVYYYTRLDEFRTEYLDKHPKIGRKTTIKQYNVVREKQINSEKFHYPLLLWLKIPDEWQTSYCIELQGQNVPDDHPLASRIKREHVEVIEVAITDSVWKWNTWWKNAEISEWSVNAWRNILIAEIFRSYRLNDVLMLTFNFRRLFSIWSRIWNEFEKNQFSVNIQDLDDSAYDQFRKALVEKCLKFRARMDQRDTFKIIMILASYLSDSQSGNWSLIKKLLWNLNFKSTIDHLVHWEFSHQEEKPRLIDVVAVSSSNSLWKLVCQQSKVIDSKELFHHSLNDPEALLMDKIRQLELEAPGTRKSSELFMPLVEAIWKEESLRVWQKLLRQYFPLCIEEKWFQEMSSLMDQLLMRQNQWIEARGSSSIFLQYGDESLIQRYSSLNQFDLDEGRPLASALKFTAINPIVY